MKIKLTLLLLLWAVAGFSKDPDGTAVLEEGKHLYRLEKAAWFGTDDFMANFSHKADSIGGYVSYITEDQKVRNVFFSRFDHDYILARYEFDSLPGISPLSVDTVNHSATDFEHDLITIRQDAIERIQNNEDEFFTFYENTSYNPIPVITDKERKVYVLTGPQTSGVVLIGNDYLLTYNKNNKFKNKKKLHRSLISLPYVAEKGGSKISSTVHTHVVSDIIDATDICTLLLYKDFVEWEQHIVFSDKYVSLFDMNKEKLLILTKKAWERMYDNIRGDK